MVLFFSYYISYYTKINVNSLLPYYVLFAYFFAYWFSVPLLYWSLSGIKYCCCIVLKAMLESYSIRTICCLASSQYFPRDYCPAASVKHCISRGRRPRCFIPCMQILFNNTKVYMILEIKPISLKISALHQ